MKKKNYANKYFEFEFENNETDEGYQSMLETFDNVQDKIENQIT